MSVQKAVGQSVFAAMLVAGVALGPWGCGGGAATSSEPSTPKPAAEAKESAGGEKVSLPGDCVDPLIDGDLHDSSRPFDKHVQYDVTGDDMDADGDRDVIVKPGWNCGESCKRSIYVMRGKCGHYVGTFTSTERFEFTAEKSHGLNDLSARPKRVEDDGEVHCRNVVYRFDGKQYQPNKTRECECKAEGAKCTAWESAN